jgi:serine/threonine protein kinase/DNA-binding SARP family transcriptional activator/WD40 repeat protein
MGLEFGVLGPVEVRADGAMLAVGGPQQRRVLAALVAEAGRVVAVDRLVEVVWPDVPPDGARQTVMKYVSRLRQSIGDGCVVTHDPGYRLVTAADAIDAVRFERLVDQARAAPPTEAVSLIDRALSLWRGRAYGEFADEWWALPDGARLEELRIVAVEQRVEALIAAGEHEQATSELEGLVVAYPLRERFVALLMRAHDASGRQAEALRAFARFRDHLAEETGLEPSDALRELESAILARDADARGGGGAGSRGYVLGDLLGEGAFGAVYKSTQPGVGRDVAVKVIRAELADDPSFVRRFEAEGQLVANLEHPHIVPLYDFWREPGGAYLVFRLLRGGSAEQLVRAHGSCALERVNRIVGEVGGALASAHAAGVVHRDVKPANVLFDDDGNAYLTDFGIAVAADTGESSSSPMAIVSAGSPLYAPPEQFQLAAPSPRGDQYSFAAMIWELLAGAAPFAGENVATILRAKLEQPVPSLHELRPDLPRDLDAVLQRATATRPEARYDDMAGLLAAWHAAVQLGATTTGDLGGPQRARGDALATVSLANDALSNPYKGLRPFGEADARHFHGRDHVTKQLVDHIQQQRFVAVVGASGSGKSSLLHAGVMPRLRDRDLRVVSMLPGDDPMSQLRNALLTVATREPETGGVSAVLQSVAVQAAEPLVVVVDQLEELWTMTPDRERERFLSGLAAIIADPTAARVHVMVCIRADFFDRPLTHGTFGALVAANTFTLTPMSRAELHEAVVAPAALEGIAFEPGLDDALVTEVADQPASLPMLQFALAELFERRRGRVIGHDSYQAIGGIAGAIATRAEAFFTNLDAAAQDATRQLLCRLVVIGDGTDDTRRRVRHSDLPLGTAEIAGELEAHRLLVADRDPTTREPTVELAHESLLRSWPRLRGWLDEDRDALRQVQHVAIAAAAWDEAGRPESELYRGARLDAAGQLVDAQPEQLTALERDFINTSSAAAVDARQREQRNRRRLRRGLAITASALVIALIAGGVAFVQRRRADDKATAATAAQVTSDAGRLAALARTLPNSQLDLALLLAVESRHLRETDASDGALEAVLAGAPAGFDGIVTLNGVECGDAVTLDGKFAAQSLSDGSIHLVNVATGQSRTLPNLTGAQPCVNTEFSVDGKHLLAVSGRSGRAVVWDVATGRQVGTTIPIGAGPWDAWVWEKRPGQVITSAGPAVNATTGTVIVWNTRDPAHPRELARFRVPSTEVWPWVWLADRAVPNLIAIGSVTYTRAQTFVWSLVTHKLAYPPLPGTAMGESPDGATLVTAEAQYRFWDTFTGKERAAPLAGITPPDLAPGAFFSRDGTRIAVEDAPTRTVRVIDLATRAQLASIPLPGAAAIVGPFLDDGRVTINDGRTMTLWRVGVTGPAPFATPLGAPTGEATAFFGPDGSRVFAASDHGLGVWDASTATPLEAPPGGPYSFSAPPTFSADGQLVAAVGRNGSIEVFDLASDEALGAIPATGRGASVVWAPRGRVLAVLAAQGQLTLWSLADPARPVRLAAATVPDFSAGAHPNLVFSPDGRTLGVVSYGGGQGQSGVTSSPVALFDVATGRLRRVLRAPAGESFDLAAFSPDSRTIATALHDADTPSGAIALWDVTTGALRASIKLSYPPFGVAYVDRGRWLATAETNDAGFFGQTTGRFELRDAATLVAIGEPIQVRGDAAFVNADRPGGNLLASGTTQDLGGPIMWDLDPAHWEQMACQFAGRNLTRAEWNQYLPGRPYEVTCPRWPSG